MHLADAGAFFLLSDSIAAAFLARYPGLPHAVFSVESRRHPYLVRITTTTMLYAYRGANPRNLRLRHGSTITHFKLHGEAGDFIALYSPGTVLGTMLAYAVNAVAENGGELHLLGADFFYLENQVYCRYIDPHIPAMHRLASRELWQYEMTLKKSAVVLLQSGFAIKTSFELAQARENMRAYIATLPEKIRIVEYSPLGLSCPRVEKRLPERIAN